MSAFQLTLRSLPFIGFAHHFYAENYKQSYGLQDNSFEIVYIKSGKLIIVYGSEVVEAPPGSIFILFRQFPIQLHTMDNTIHSHCSIQLCTDFTIQRIDQPDYPLCNHSGLLLPMVLLPSEETKQIGLMLHQVIAKLQTDRNANHQSCVLTILGILGRIDHLFREKISSNLPASILLGTRIVEYIDIHLHESLTMEQIAASIGRSPNYLNAIFKQLHGIPIRQYINKQKAERIAQLMVNKNASFSTACENLAIYDTSYGYRLFKKHMGITPQQYIASVHRH